MPGKVVAVAIAPGQGFPTRLFVTEDVFQEFWETLTRKQRSNLAVLIYRLIES